MEVIRPWEKELISSPKYSVPNRDDVKFTFFIELKGNQTVKVI